MPEIQELEMFALRERPPGSLPSWVRWVILFACAVTVFAAAAGADALWQQDEHAIGIGRRWFDGVLAIPLAIWIAVSAAPAWRVSRWIRMAVLLPVAHLTVLVVVWAMWPKLSAWLPRSLADAPMLNVLPISTCVAGGAIVCVVAGWVIAGRRRAERLQATVMIALAQLLLLGLWIPSVCQVWCHDPNNVEWTTAGIRLAAPGHLAAIMVVPPTIIAIGFAAVASRRPDLVRRHRAVLWTLLALLFLNAFSSRVDASSDAYLLYGNFVPALMAQAVVAITAVLALGIGGAVRANRRAKHAHQISGVIAADEAATDVIAGFEITSWLRGPRSLTRPFTVTTPAGDIPVPGGVELVAALPAVTTLLGVGESVEVLRCGDRVVLDGFVAPDDGHPFRGTLAACPGPDGIAVIVPGRDERDLANTALGLWRPCVAYLLILVALGIPAIIAVLSVG